MSANDLIDLGQQWQVLPSEPQLFQTPSPYAFGTCLPPEVKGRRRLGEAMPMEDAEDACAQYEGAKKDMCIFDVVAMNDVDAAHVHGVF